MKQGNVQSSSCYCDVCGRGATEYRSYDVVLFRRCSTDNTHNVYDVQKYSATTSKHQRMIADIEPDYKQALVQVAKQKLPISPLAVTPVLPKKG